MFDFKPYINLGCGEKSYDRINLKEEKQGEASLVYVEALSGGFDAFDKDLSIDAEKGVCIDITPDKSLRYMANYRSIQWWCDPYFGEDYEKMPSDTQFLVIEKGDGLYAVVVPVVNDEYKCVFEGNSKESFTARIFSLCENMYSCEGLAFVYAEGKNPLELTEKCVKAALKALNTGTRFREKRRYPEVLEYLGWCSWNAMKIRVNEQGMLDKCEEFKTKNIPVKWAILDDMWADIRSFCKYKYGDKHMDMINLMYSSALHSFEAAPERFPEGLKKCIEKIKQYGMKVCVWHPTTGYWRGIEEGGEAYRQLSDYLIKCDRGYYVPNWKKEKSYMYYKTIHDFFRQCGADFVKIDNQSMIDRLYKGQAPIGKIARELHSGMEASVGEHFDGAVINCMGMASESIWSRSTSAVSRCSNDFKPESKEWFTKHILQCAYNSIFQGQFYWCDWDMWWTDDGQARKNSLMRAISGGPIYVSDMIDRSNADVFEPLVLSDGSILRCDRPAMPSYDCITQDCRTSGNALKLQNTTGEYGVMAVLNIDENENPVNAKVSAEFIEGFDADEIAVYEHFSKQLTILKKNESFDVTLKNSDDYKLYIFAPVKDGFAAIGRTDKFISPKTIKYVHKEDIVLKEDGPYAYVKDGKLFEVR